MTQHDVAIAAYRAVERDLHQRLHTAEAELTRLRDVVAAYVCERRATGVYLNANCPPVRATACAPCARKLDRDAQLRAALTVIAAAREAADNRSLVADRVLQAALAAYDTRWSNDEEGVMGGERKPDGFVLVCGNGQWHDGRIAGEAAWFDRVGNRESADENCVLTDKGPHRVEPVFVGAAPTYSSDRATVRACTVAPQTAAAIRAARDAFEIAIRAAGFDPVTGEPL